MSVDRHEPRDDSARKLGEIESVGFLDGTEPTAEAPSGEDARTRSSEERSHDCNPTHDSMLERHMDELIRKLRGKPACPRGERRPGMRLGGYQLERKLGAGGMGEVFAARDIETGEVVALKTLNTTSASRLYRFKREFRTLADVSHRNLVRLHDLTVDARGSAYLTMELLDGMPFVAWVRASTPEGKLPDLTRLEDGLRQLVEGVRHLHDLGCIHRDLKPSNVLVTSEGRVVILDFGLVSERSDPDAGITRDSQIVGTPSYMAPEQALGKRVGPAADYYAIGVMLFECLTGRQPHEGPPLLQLLVKHDATPDPGVTVAEVPDWLRRICVRLLARDPDARPDAQELLELLRASSIPMTGLVQAFVGRRNELAVLRAALQEVRDRREPVIVHLRGKSGFGKSALVRRFRSELRGTEVIVLHGRCREREAVPYKGVDAVVDALSAYLRRLPETERAALRPPDLEVLVRMFPVLDEIWEATQAPALDPNEVRKLGGVTLRKLVTRIAGTHPLVLHIDDFQWADLDSVSLLQTMFGPPEPPAMMLLLAYRSEAEDSDALRVLMTSDVLAGLDVRTIELGALSACDACTLASSLLRLHGARDQSSPSSRAEAIALRSRGIPFFISQMAHCGGELDGTDSNLDQIIADRLSELERPAQDLLQIVAVFGGPLSIDLALELCDDSTEATVASLCGLGLLVRDESSNDERRGRLETTHDRVREAVLAKLDTDERALIHRQIGERLLERHDGTGDGLFAIVDHLGAGMQDVGELPDESRLEFAGLNCSAGERAFELGAWVVARRYLGCAYELVTPWLPQARNGRGPYELCVTVAFSRARTEIALGNPAGDAAIADLLDWSLSMSDYCRIAVWYSWNLSLRTQWPECVEFGMKALDHLGFRIPRRPSWPRALLSYVWGLWKIRRTGRDRMEALLPSSDDRIRAGMEILTATGNTALYVDVKLHLFMMGVHGRMLTNHGFHESAIVALSSLVISAATRGKIHEAQELHELVQGLRNRRSTSVFAEYLSQITLLVGLPIFRPVHAMVADGQRIYQRACEVAPQGLVEMIGMSCDYVHALAGIPLPLQVEFLDAMEARHGGFKLAWVRDRAVASRCLIHSMTRGPAHRTQLPSFDELSSFGEVPRIAFTVSIIWTALFVGDHGRAWEFTCSIARGYERKLRASWYAPLYAMLSVVVIAARWSSSSNRERRRLWRAIRKRRVTAQRWAERCAENYQPMLDVIDGEIAGIEGRYQEAATAFEHARTVASEGRMLWLSGLASERLANLARRQGHALFAEAAFEAAREAYEAWGALAVVRRLDQDRAATSSS